MFLQWVCQWLEAKKENEKLCESAALNALKSDASEVWWPPASYASPFSECDPASSLCEHTYLRVVKSYSLRVHIIMSSQSRPHSSIQVFYISEVSSSSASFIFFFWVWSWHLPKDYFIKHSASHSAEKASSSRDASQALSEVAKADFSSVIFESLVRKILWGSLILLQTHHLVQS